MLYVTGGRVTFGSDCRGRLSVPKQVAGGARGGQNRVAAMSLATVRLSRRDVSAFELSHRAGEPVAEEDPAPADAEGHESLSEEEDENKMPTKLALCIGAIQIFMSYFSFSIVIPTSYSYARTFNPPAGFPSAGILVVSIYISPTLRTSLNRLLPLHPFDPRGAAFAPKGRRVRRVSPGPAPLPISCSQELRGSTVLPVPLHVLRLRALRCGQAGRVARDGRHRPDDHGARGNRLPCLGLLQRARW